MKKIATILTINALYEKATKFAQIKKVLCKALPSEVHAQLSIRDIQQGLLLLSVPSPAMATHIRHQAPTLLKTLNQSLGMSLMHLQCQVCPQTESVQVEKKLPPRKAVPISARSQQKLKDLSAHIKDKTLANALKKLAT